MNHLFQTKPYFQAIVNKQAMAYQRLNKQTTSRTIIERGGLERSLAPVSVANVELPRLPLVQLKQDASQKWVLLGEVAQIPGKVILLSLDGSIETNRTADELELVPPIA